MSIALSLGNNLTTGGVFKAAAVNNTSCNNITDFAGVTGDATLVLLSTQTASGSASISFTTGIDSTYDEYVFKIINCHPSIDCDGFGFNLSTDGGSNYNVTKTSATFWTNHDEADTATTLGYTTSSDLAQETGYQRIGGVYVGGDADQSCSGTLTLYAPSSTTYVKHYTGLTNASIPSDYSVGLHVAGYGNTTSAINAIIFAFESSANITGTIKMYGVKKS